MLHSGKQSLSRHVPVESHEQCKPMQVSKCRLCNLGSRGCLSKWGICTKSRPKSTQEVHLAWLGVSRHAVGNSSPASPGDLGAEWSASLRPGASRPLRAAAAPGRELVAGASEELSGAPGSRPFVGFFLCFEGHDPEHAVPGKLSPGPDSCKAAVLYPTLCLRNRACHALSVGRRRLVEITSAVPRPDVICVQDIGQHGRLPLCTNTEIHACRKAWKGSTSSAKLGVQHIC